MLLVQMTSYVELTLWGGLTAPKKEAVEAIGIFLPDPHPSIMAAGAPAQTFFDILSRCRSTDHLFSVVDEHYHASHNANNTPSPHALRYYNPTEYHITEVALFKQRYVVQHEGFVFRVHHQPQDTLPAEPDFLVAVDRNIDSTKTGFSFVKFAVDHVSCSLVHPTAPELEGTFRRPIVWRMPAPHHDYIFDMNLYQISVLFEVIRQWTSEYHVTRRNCFWQSYIIRTAIHEIIQSQQQLGITVTAYEPVVHGVTIGNCFGFHFVPEDQGETTEIVNKYHGLYGWLQGAQA